MLKENKIKDISWVDLENPTQEEVRKVLEDHDISPLVADELLSPTMRSRVDMYDDYIYMILHFPSAHSEDKKIQSSRGVQEIDFIIGKEFLITTHYDVIDAIHEFSKVFEVSSILDKGDMKKHAGFIFFYMIKFFYKEMMDKIENVRNSLTDIENEVFSGNEKQMVVELSNHNRILLSFKESIALHEEVLQSFEIAGQHFFGESFKYHLQKVLGEYYRVQSSLLSTQDYLRELRDTNDSLLSSKQNETMKTLTVMAFVFLPLTLIAGIFGMNTTDIPFLGSNKDFEMILVLMVLTALFMFIIVKTKKWL